MKKLRVVLMLLSTLIVGSLIAPVTPVQAADNGANFTITPVYPKNQTDTSLGYFALVTPPEQKGTVTVDVANTDPKNTRTIKVSAVNATTSDAGQINYTPSDRKADKSATYTMAQLLSNPVTLKLKPQTSQKVTFNYTIPKGGFEGTILGSIYAVDETKSAASKEQFALNNRFAMAIGISMTTDASLVTAPNLKLGKVQAQANNANKPVVTAQLRNVAPTYFRQMTIDAYITKRGADKKLYTAKLKDGSMAPNSAFDYAIDTDDKAIPAGEYTLKMTVKATGKAWRFTRDFTITGEQARKLAEKTGQKASTPWWVWALIAFFILLILIIIWLIWRLRRQKKGADNIATPETKPGD